MAGHVLQRRILLLAFAILAVSVAGLLLQFALYDSADPDPQPPIARAVASAEVTLCLNRPPAIDALDCAVNATQNTTYTCQLNATDQELGSLTFLAPVFDPDIEPLLNLTSSGLINFTPTNDDVGDHTITFIVRDNASCSNSDSNVSLDLTVLNINDPPYLETELPDVTFTANTTIFPFFLVDYFTDPDGDAMAFTSTTPTGITVIIDGSSLVSFTSSSCDSSGELITFTATDPSNASAVSNVVTITVTCPSVSTGDSGSDSDGSGGGGGGSGSICPPNWVCDEWFACLPDGVQWQRCYDSEGCSVDRYLQRACEYTGEPLVCMENWLCEPWSSCAANSSQQRTCEDLATCGTTVLQPPLTQECVYLATCFDGVRNGEETGIDCGGACGACPVEEMPGSVVQRAWWILLLVLLGLLIAGGAAGYYRDALARSAAALGFLLRHRVKKDILLDAAQRKALFERIRALETADGDDVAQRYDELAELARSYLADALALPLEATADEVTARVRALTLRPETAGLVDGLLAKLAVIEGEELTDDPLFYQASLEEIRTAVCLTSEYAIPEIERPMEEYPITDGMSFYDEIFARMIAVLRAIQHGQTETARAEYLELLRHYDPLGKEEQEQIYPELRWLFGVTRLASEAVGGRIVNKARFENVA